MDKKSMLPQETGGQLLAGVAFMLSSRQRVILYYCNENMSMENSKKIFRIKGSIKHYEWGGKTFLPALLHLPNPEGKPFAEYWLGTQPGESFEKLPYLFKVQDVEKMLSIQVHPTLEVARKKFAEENERGIPPDAPHRNYKDQNHKPEILSPLSDFYLLHGFKEQDQMHRILSETAELGFLKDIFANGNYQRLYETVMKMPQEEVNQRLKPLLDRILPLYNSGSLQKTQEDFWAARAAITFNRGDNIDRGIFSIYLFNIVKMREGQALFQDAGLPHAYLEGHTMELMANSDNVLRGGLTPKHVDVPELLEQVRYVGTRPNVIDAGTDAAGEQVYKTPATDFQLSRLMIRPENALSIPTTRTDIYFVYAGNIDVAADDQHESFAAGEAFLVVPGTVAHVSSRERAVVYRATEPVIS